MGVGAPSIGSENLDRKRKLSCGGGRRCNQDGRLVSFWGTDQTSDILRIIRVIFLNVIKGTNHRKE